MMIYRMVFLLVVVKGNHFRGGIISMSPLYLGNKTMEISLHVSYARKHVYTAECDSDTVREGKLVGSHPEEQAIFCTEGCPQKELVSLVRYICTDFSLTDQWEYGERKVIYSFPNSTKIKLSAQGCCWLRPFHMAKWDLFIVMDLTLRPDTLTINSAPQARFFPMIRVQAGCTSTISILPYDPDGDIVRCRWGNATTGECAGICNGIPGAVLDISSCTLTYISPSDDSGYKAVAIMMEDFSLSDNTFQKPYSTVSLNFLVFVYNSDFDCHEAKPQFLPPTPTNLSCLAVPPGETYSGQIAVYSGTAASNITEIRTVGPVGVMKSFLTHVGEQVSYVNITWTPKEENYFQNNNRVEVMCFSAVGSNGQESQEICTQWIAGIYPPKLNLEGINRPMVHPVSPEFIVSFDQSVRRSHLPAKVKFLPTGGKTEVYSIQINEKSAKGLIEFFGNSTVKIKTLYRFEERQRYDMIFEEGFVKGVIGCGAESTASDIYMFIVRDVTPPKITYTKKPKLTNSSASVEWYFDEPVSQVECDLYFTNQNEGLLDSTKCENGTWKRSGLAEGYYKLEIKVSDEYGNEVTYYHRWHVDLTPPVVQLVPPFNGNITNQEKPIFLLQCPIEESCKFSCRYGATATEAQPFPCDTGVFETPVFNYEAFLAYTAEDAVGNEAAEQSFQWVVDLIAPKFDLGTAQVVTTRCDANLSLIPPPIISDNMDLAPSLNYTDNGHKGDCEVSRTWKATDAAGNSETLQQTIILTFIPELNYVKSIRIPCELDKDINIPNDTANADNACGRKIILDHIDNSSGASCPGQIIRTWYYKDSCTPLAQQKMVTQTINFFQICPKTACGRHLTPPHGTCIDDKCICNKPWYGEDCGSYIEEPVMVNPGLQTIKEGFFYREELKLSRGSQPVTWQITSEIQSLKLLNGVIEWEVDEVGEFMLYVRVDNTAGFATVSWNLSVVPGYKTHLYELPSALFIKAVPVILSGYIEYEPANLLQGKGIDVPIDILISLSGSTRIFKVWADQKGSFNFTFEPFPTEYGLYEAVSKHPGSNPVDVPIKWKVLGFKFIPPSVSISEKSAPGVDLHVQNVTVLLNSGPGDLTNITGHGIAGATNNVQLAILFEGKLMVSKLQAGKSVHVGISIKSLQPFNWQRVYINVRSGEGVSSLLIINIRIADLEPHLFTAPEKIEEDVLRGQQKIIQVNITNNGEATARSVTAQVPNVALFSVINYGKSSYSTEPKDLFPGESILLILLLSPRIESKLGLYKGSIPIGSGRDRIILPVQIKVISNNLATVTFRVEDEYTYFAHNRPPVNNAKIRIHNRNRGISQTKVTINGLATFEDIPEETYEVFVHAPRHQSERSVNAIKGGPNSFRIFLKRTTVNYRWTVTPTDVKDVYKINIEADFEARVPVPVVTITPMSIDLEPYELGIQESLQFNVTNHGLIKVESTKLTLPANHPILEFHIIGQPSSLEALASAIIPVKVTRKDSTGWSNSTSSCGYSGSYIFSYECGDWILRNIKINFGINRLPCGEGWWWRGDGGSGQLLHWIGSSPSSNFFCDPCFQSFVECAWSLTFPSLPSIQCSTVITTGLFGEPNAKDLEILDDCVNELIETYGGLVKDTIYSYSQSSKSNGKRTSLGDAQPDTNNQKDQKASKIIGKRIFNKIFDIFQTCFPNIADKCGLYDYLPEPLQGPIKTLVTSFGRKKRDVKQNVVKDYVKAIEPFIVLTQWKREIFGDDVWMIENNWNWFQTYFVPLIADDSEIGKGISLNELKTLSNSERPFLVDTEDVEKFVTRWNISLFDWQSGRFEPNQRNPDRISYGKIRHYKSEIVKLNQLARNAGYQNFVEQYNDKIVEVNKLKQNMKDKEGVCAIVRIKIEQELALTREGFIAKLEIENGETSTLKGIDVIISIKKSDSGEEVNSLFSIGNATIGGDMKADRSLEPMHFGELEWLMIPYSAAAPSDDTFFDIGGMLHYDIDGSIINAPLLAATIRVRPDPVLNIYYFWEKFVISDDPFTKEIEPAIPFILAVAVKNIGNGTAFDMRMTSSQPEIIENDKGLYVNFKLIGASIGNQVVLPSLLVNFGDVLPGKTVVAKWSMVCSLKGMFQNYSANFENNNPLGDPRLSLIDELIVKELVHEVLITGMDTEDDDIGDFLINEKNDLDTVPDFVFSSLTMNNFSVMLQNTKGVQITRGEDGSLQVYLNATANGTGFVYFRYSLPVVGSKNVLVNSMSLRKEVGIIKETMPSINAWLTAMIGEEKSSSLTVHLFDLVKSSEVGKHIVYIITFGADVHAENVNLRMTEQPPVTADIQPLSQTTTFMPVTTEDMHQVRRQVGIRAWRHVRRHTRRYARRAPRF